MHTVDALLGRDGPGDLADQNVHFFRELDVGRKTTHELDDAGLHSRICLLYTSPSPRD